MSLGAEIARLRIAKGWRQKDLAAQVNVLQSHVARWENDMNRPRRRMLQKLADALAVPIEYLLAADRKDGTSRLVEEQDAVLAELLRQVHKIEPQDREALKTILQTMLTKAQMHELLVRPSPAIGTSPPESERKNRPRLSAKRSA